MNLHRPDSCKPENIEAVADIKPDVVSKNNVNNYVCELGELLFRLLYRCVSQYETILQVFFLLVHNINTI